MRPIKIVSELQQQRLDLSERNLDSGTDLESRFSLDLGWYFPPLSSISGPDLSSNFIWFCFHSSCLKRVKPSWCSFSFSWSRACRDAFLLTAVISGIIWVAITFLHQLSYFPFTSHQPCASISRDCVCCVWKSLALKSKPLKTEISDVWCEYWQTITLKHGIHNKSEIFYCSCSRGAALLFWWWLDQVQRKITVYGKNDRKLENAAWWKCAPWCGALDLGSGIMCLLHWGSRFSIEKACPHLLCGWHYRTWLVRCETLEFHLQMFPNISDCFSFILFIYYFINNWTCHLSRSHNCWHICSYSHT